jgi:UrcA family protein
MFRVLRGSPAQARRICAANRQAKETIVNPSTPSSIFRGLVPVAIFALIALTFSFVAAADPSSASRTVKFADLNTSTPSGAHELYMRILAAAQVVCSYVPFATDGEKANCVRDTIEAAVMKINQPALSVLHKPENNPPVPGGLVSPSR